MSGLESIGIAGPDFLREALTNCSDPLRAIEDFQLENGILLPSLRPMLPLLDLHGVPRLEFHQSVLEELKQRLISQIQRLGQSDNKEKDKKFKELLNKCFPLVSLKPFRCVVMSVLKYIDHIDNKYLKVLMDDKQLYMECDTVVKQQIWEDSQSLFGDEVSPLLSQYIKEKESLFGNHENPANLFFGSSPKVRRQGEVVQKLTKMIGKNVKLYDMVLQFLRTLFLRTRNVHYCTLRVEIMMSLHDLDVQEITSVDPCHKFAWCLDACIRERNVDVKRSRELQGFLDGIRRGQEQVLGDISMALCDPYAVNLLATSVLKYLQHMINNETLPRDNPVLILLLRLLSIGLHAWDMIDSQCFKEPKFDVHLITQFLPALMSLMVDDQVRLLNSKLPQDDRESAITTIEHSGPPPDIYPAFVQESIIANTLAMYYTLHTARLRDRQGLMRVLGLLGNNENDRSLEDPFLHSLVSLLIPMADEFANEDFSTVVFDEFFFTSIARENVLRHLLKLLWHVHPKMVQSRLDLLIKALQPATQHSEAIHSLHQQLLEKLQTPQPSPSQSLESMDSPLMSVLKTVNPS
ncbi:hypothetical protein CHUAL_006054 [Chamberlinius hualienensis]